MADRGIGVVGGGPSGLAAAWRLSAAGRRVRVYEARGVVGGGLRTEPVSGVGADVAVQLVSDGYVRLLEMLRDLGVADRLAPVPGRDAMWRGGRPHGLRYGSVSSMVASGALPPGLKLRMGLRYLPFLERNAGVLDLNAPVRAAEAGLDGVSIAEWGRREVDEAFVELLASPLLAAYYGVAAEETSAAFFHCLARAGMGVNVLGARAGMGLLSEAVAAALRARGAEVWTGRRVEGVRLGEDHASLEVDGETVEHDAVVLAVPPAVATDLVPGIPFLAEVRHRSTAALVLATRGRTATGWFGLSIPRSQLPGSPLAAICVQEEKGTSLGGADRGALVLVPTPEAGERWTRQEAREVLESALPTVDRVLPGVRERVLEARLVRLAGGCVPYPGYFDRLRSFNEDTLPVRLALAGDYLVSPTVEGAVRGGIRAADRLRRGGW